MLSADEAKKIGIDACIEKLGFEFCKKHADNATSAYGEDDGIMNCFVGVDDSPAPNSDIKDVDELILTSMEEWPYYASCNVNMSNGKIQFLRCVLPK